MIDAMVRKLDACQGVGSTEHCQSDCASVSFMELREILLAGKEEQPKDSFDKRLINIGNWVEEIERRVAELEDKKDAPAVEVDRWMHTEACDSNQRHGGDCICKPSATPVECNHEWIAELIGDEKMLAFSGNIPDLENAMFDTYCRKCGMSKIQPVTHSEPSDSVTISRNVAENWLNHEDFKYNGLGGARPMADEVRKALERKCL